MWQARSLITLYGFTLILVLFGQSWIFWCWMLPLVLGQPFLRAYLLTEHRLCPQVANMFENTHTTFTNRVIRFLAWNMPYHAEHHAYPAVPFYKLPQFQVYRAINWSTHQMGISDFTWNIDVRFRTSLEIP